MLSPYSQADFYCAMYISTDSVTSWSKLLQPPYGDRGFRQGVGTQSTKFLFIHIHILGRRWVYFFLPILLWSESESPWGGAVWAAHSPRCFYWLDSLLVGSNTANQSSDQNVRFWSSQGQSQSYLCTYIHSLTFPWDISHKLFFLRQLNIVHRYNDAQKEPWKEYVCVCWWEKVYVCVTGSLGQWVVSENTISIYVIT